MYEQEQIKPYGEEGTKREQVEQMFDNIAHSYDTLNHTLSFGVDKIWRNNAIDFLPKNRKSTARVLVVPSSIAIIYAMNFPLLYMLLLYTIFFRFSSYL